MSCAADASGLRFYRGWHLVLLAWLLAFSTRPLVLGFYDDDWMVLLIPAQTTAAFSWGRLVHFVELYANRPMFGLISYIMSSVCNESLLLWHSLMSVNALFAALALRWLLRATLRLCGRERTWAADVATALWLVFPFTMGAMARPTQNPCLWAVVFTAGSGALLFDGWRRGRAEWLRPSLLFLAGCLTYEALYGSFVVLLLVGLACGVPGRVGGRRFTLAAGGLAAVQLLAIGWNRMVPWVTAFAPSKSFCPGWAGIFVDNVLRLRFFIGLSAREYSPIIEGLLLVLLLVCGLLLVRQLWSRRERLPAVRTFGVWLACGVGVAIGLLVLSVAGYSLRGVGLGSRTALAVSVWMTVVMATAAAAVSRRPRGLRSVAAYGTFMLATLLLMSTHHRIADWAGAWESQWRALAEAPLTDLRAADPDAVVLYFGPELHNGVRTFGYMGNIDRAMEYVYPESGSLRFCCAARDNWITSWDGRNFEQRLARGNPWDRWKVWNQVEAPQVWVWVRGTGRARQVTAPFVYQGATNNDVAPEHVFRVELPFEFGEPPKTAQGEESRAASEAREG